MKTVLYATLKWTLAAIIVIAALNFVWRFLDLDGTPGSFVSGIARATGRTLSPTVAKYQPAPRKNRPEGEAGLVKPASSPKGRSRKGNFVLVEVWDSDQIDENGEFTHSGGWARIDNLTAGTSETFHVEAGHPSEYKTVKGSMYRFAPVNGQGYAVGGQVTLEYNGAYDDGSAPVVKLVRSLDTAPPPDIPAPPAQPDPNAQNAQVGD